MKFIDLHCDTLMQAYEKSYTDIYETDTSLDIKRMNEAGQMAQFFAIFMPPESGSMYADKNYTDEKYIEYTMKVFKNSIKAHNDIIEFAGTYSDIIENARNNKMSALLTFEDGRAIDSSFENLKEYYNRGIRLISLTWNFENCFGFPNSKDVDIMKRGLKKFGKEAVEYMNELGIIVDVSHLSDGGFYDVASISKKPFLASHSNSRSITNHPRNLTDEMLKILANRGGITGINFESSFLKNPSSDGKINSDSKIEYMVQHIAHIRNVAGIDALALGSDFDGIGGNLEVSEPRKVYLIFEALKKQGFSENDIEKIAYKNALRFMSEVLK